MSLSNVQYNEQRTLSFNHNLCSETCSSQAVNCVARHRASDAVNYRIDKRNLASPLSNMKSTPAAPFLAAGTRAAAAESASASDGMLQMLSLYHFEVLHAAAYNAEYVVDAREYFFRFDHLCLHLFADVPHAFQNLTTKRLNCVLQLE